MCRNRGERDSAIAAGGEVRRGGARRCEVSNQEPNDGAASKRNSEKAQPLLAASCGTGGSTDAADVAPTQRQGRGSRASTCGRVTGIEVATVAGVCGGRATVAGTRIPVWAIQSLWLEGANDAEVVIAYPSLEGADFDALRRYIADHIDEITADITDQSAE